MLRNDTLDKGPSKLLLHLEDMSNYNRHVFKLNTARNVVKLAKGEHIIRMTDHRRNEREKQFETTYENQLLYNKIVKIAGRKPYRTARWKSVRPARNPSRNEREA